MDTTRVVHIPAPHEGRVRHTWSMKFHARHQPLHYPSEAAVHLA